MNELGRTLKKMRENRNYTIVELAKKAGLGKGTIGDIETGKSRSTINTVDIIAKTLELNHEERKEIFFSMLPKDIKRKQKTSEEEFYDFLFEFLKKMNISEQKLILNTVVEKLEHIILKNNTYDENKDLLEEIKEKIEEL